jgi:hypothetical protein
MFYSNTILSRMSSDGGIKPKTGTYLLGITNFIGASLSFLIIRKFPRKKILLVGHTLMTIFLTLVGVFAFYNYSTSVLVSMILFLVSF